jgi:two-component system, OmpR family, KDP operon response regulator KdpE
VSVVATVLVVDDDRALLRALRVGLAARGHDVVTAATGQEGLTKVALEDPDVVVLDLGLPDLDGLEVCRRIRQWSEVPVIVLSATGREDRKVAALDGGADDYVTKPFGMAELEARIRASLRHARQTTGNGDGRIVVGDLEIDPASHVVLRSGRRVELTSKEFELLAYLARHAGKVCTHRTILGHVWGGEYGSESEYLRVYVYRLRRKLGDADGRLVRTAPGIGYSLAEPDERRLEAPTAPGPGGPG